MPAFRRTSRGYTLIEVLTVVVVLGIAAAVVVPVIMQPASLTIQAAARQIITDILLAQNEAVGAKATRRVVFDVAANRYTLTDGGANAVSFNWKPGPYTIDFTQDSRFAGVKITAANFADSATLSFDDLGGPSSGGTVDLGAAGYRYRITVAPFTGRVTVAPVSG